MGIKFFVEWKSCFTYELPQTKLDTLTLLQIMDPFMFLYHKFLDKDAKKPIVIKGFGNMKEIFFYIFKRKLRDWKSSKSIENFVIFSEFDCPLSVQFLIEFRNFNFTIWFSQSENCKFYTDWLKFSKLIHCNVHWLFQWSSNYLWPRKFTVSRKL